LPYTRQCSQETPDVAGNGGCCCCCWFATSPSSSLAADVIGQACLICCRHSSSDRSTDVSEPRGRTRQWGPLLHADRRGRSSCTKPADVIRQQLNRATTTKTVVFTRRRFNLPQQSIAGRSVGCGGNSTNGVSQQTVRIGEQDGNTATLNDGSTGAAARSLILTCERGLLIDDTESAATLPGARYNCNKKTRQVLRWTFVKRQLIVQCMVYHKKFFYKQSMYDMEIDRINICHQRPTSRKN
jgi:hypothetical protein